ncbi:MAG: DNA repair protein RadC [Verrucomicrobiae bacterium]|nr:DNA repair protein RadC [Verrucomicrobiae bacterium]
MDSTLDDGREAVAPILMRDFPLSERPREHLARFGAERCSNAQLLAILLRTGTKGRNVIHVAEDLLARFGSLEALSRATVEQLCKISGVGRDKAVTLLAAFQLAVRMAREKAHEQPLLDSPDKVADLLREENAQYQTEQFQLVLLNTRRRLIRVEKLAQGTLDSVTVHPRDVFRLAIAANASAIILVHNHPSGDPSPSEADLRLTRDLIRAGYLLRIEVLDHVILGRPGPGREKDYASLRAMGAWA